MNKAQYLEEFKALTDRMYEITKAKNSDYSGNSEEPFKNFTMVETMGFATTKQGFCTRMTDKMMRIAGFVKNGTLQVKDESVEDTLLDCANYCLLFICYLRSKRAVDNLTTNKPPEVYSERI